LKGLVLDSCVLIAEERRRGSVENLLHQIDVNFGPVDVGISTVTVAELTQGAYRARTVADKLRRQVFAEAAVSDLYVYPVTLEIAQLAGRIEGEQAAKGISIPFEDVIIGSTAIFLGFDVLTDNTRHFQLIPGLNAVPL
jgi:predicted nucleic acid-binding protein